MSEIRRDVNKNTKKTWEFPGGPVVRTPLPLPRAQVQSLVRELGSHKPHGHTHTKKDKSKHQT